MCLAVGIVSGIIIILFFDVMDIWGIIRRRRSGMASTGSRSSCCCGVVADNAVVTVKQVHDTCIFNVGTIASTTTNDGISFQIHRR